MQENAVRKVSKNLNVCGHAINRFHQGNREWAGEKPNVNPFSWFRRAFKTGEVVAREIVFTRGISGLRSVLAYDGFEIVVESRDEEFMIVTFMPLKRKQKTQPKRKKEFDLED